MATATVSAALDPTPSLTSVDAPLQPAFQPENSSSPDEPEVVLQDEGPAPSGTAAIPTPTPSPPPASAPVPVESDKQSWIAKSYRGYRCAFVKQNPTKRARTGGPQTTLRFGPEEEQLMHKSEPNRRNWDYDGTLEAASDKGPIKQPKMLLKKILAKTDAASAARIATWEAAAKKLDAAKAAFRYDGTAPDVRRKAAAKIEELQNEPILRYTGPKVPIWRRTMDRLDVHEVMKEVKERREETHRDAAEKSRRQSVAAGKLTASDRMRAAEKHAADRHASTSSSSPADSSQEQTQYRSIESLFAQDKTDAKRRKLSSSGAAAALSIPPPPREDDAGPAEYDAKGDADDADDGSADQSSEGDGDGDGDGDADDADRKTGGTARHASPEPASSDDVVLPPPPPAHRRASTASSSSSSASSSPAPQSGGNGPDNGKSDSNSSGNAIVKAYRSAKTGSGARGRGGGRSAGRGGRGGGGRSALPATSTVLLGVDSDSDDVILVDSDSDSDIKYTGTVAGSWWDKKR